MRKTLKYALILAVPLFIRGTAGYAAGFFPEGDTAGSAIVPEGDSSGGAIVPAGSSSGTGILPGRRSTGSAVIPDGSPSGADFAAPSGSDYTNHRYDSPIYVTNRPGPFVRALLQITSQAGYSPEPERHGPPPGRLKTTSALSIDPVRWIGGTFSLRYEIIYENLFGFSILFDNGGEQDDPSSPFGQIWDLGLGVSVQIVRGTFFAPSVEAAMYAHTWEGHSAETYFPAKVTAACKFFLPTLHGPFIEPRAGISIIQGAVDPVIGVSLGFEFGKGN